jgi:ribonuclease BN (tRNA processing enzyme)
LIEGVRFLSETESEHFTKVNPLAPASSAQIASLNLPEKIKTILSASSGTKTEVVNPGVLRFSFLESGRGATILIDFPDGQKSVVDCCTSTTGCRPDIETEIAAQRIAFICLTHPHLDHGKDIPAILGACLVKELWHSLPGAVPFIYWISQSRKEEVIGGVRISLSWARPEGRSSRI